mmetsp:Transcript_12588/g.34403  ORF Transcript_12588/g.34403 Transcript_12588/m.34403 type:complete len:84 (-) Transcript_12588:263-514(-)
MVGLGSQSANSLDPNPLVGVRAIEWGPHSCCSFKSCWLAFVAFSCVGQESPTTVLCKWIIWSTTVYLLEEGHISKCTNNGGRD